MCSPKFTLDIHKLFTIIPQVVKHFGVQRSFRISYWSSKVKVFWKLVTFNWKFQAFFLFISFFFVFFYTVVCRGGEDGIIVRNRIWINQIWISFCRLCIPARLLPTKEGDFNLAFDGLLRYLLLLFLLVLWISPSFHSTQQHVRWQHQLPLN